MPENADRKQAGGKFKPGQSGNPAGKPKGARHRATLAAQELLDGEGEAITRKAVELAKEGHPVALKLVMDRILPPRRDSPISITLPPISTASDLAEATGHLVQAVAQGELSPSEGQAVATLLETRRKALETLELQNRLEALERAMEVTG